MAQGKRGLTTVYDVAQVTGFGAETVYRALNGTGVVDAKTAAFIKETAAKMGYSQAAARGGLSRLIGVIYDDAKMARGFSHPLFSGVLDRFRAKIEEDGYEMVFMSSRSAAPYEERARALGLEAVALVNIDEENYDNVKGMASWSIPCVSMGAVVPDVCSVLTDNEKAGRDAAERFIRAGHKKIAYLSAPWSEFSPAALERLEGLRRGMEEHGMKFDESLVEKCARWNEGAGFDGFARLWERARDFTAIFVSSDPLARGAMDCARERGVRIPDDISIIGFDDDSVSRFCVPRLTTFRQSKESIADTAVEMLRAQINGGSVPRGACLPARMVERDSVKDISKG